MRIQEVQRKKSCKAKQGRKPANVPNDHCQICNCSFALMGTKCSNENLFLPSGRWECTGSVLVDKLSIFGVKLVQGPGKSDKVCCRCTIKIRNAAKCIMLNTRKLTENDAQPEEQKNHQFSRKFIYPIKITQVTEKIVADSSNNSTSSS